MAVPLDDFLSYVKASRENMAIFVVVVFIGGRVVTEWFKSCRRVVKRVKKIAYEC